MVEQAGAGPGEAETSLADSRAQFISSLGRRLDALRHALAALEQAPSSAAHRDHLRRRIHAFGAAAGVLGFDRVFETFKQAEAALGRAGSVGTLGPNELALVVRAVDLVPSLVLGADVSLGTSRARLAAPDRQGGGWPTSVLVFGPKALAESLAETVAPSAPAIECERTEEVARAEELVRAMAPDVAVIDGDRRGARELVETLVHDPLLDPVRIVVVGTFDRPEAAAHLVALGAARVLPKPVGPEALRRAVIEVARERSLPAPRIEPLGDVTIEALSERVAQEVRRGLVDALGAHTRGATIPLGEGVDVLAAVWASVARIRELVTMHSGGAVRFRSHGPEGAVPLAPWMTDDRRLSGEHRGGDDVTLSGRKVLVADDDPAVAWFLSGLLRAAGAQVIEALDGQEALELVRREWPEVVVSDILMPGIDGFSLCREIKRDVALSDVPVILLSWKEDLLQRVRELGVEAEGYLRKEATASTVVQRVREVLLPRARIEARIGAGGEARGRLDGVTPRLILDIVCRRGQDAHISIRDAAFLYEVDVRGGRLQAVARTTPEGRGEHGERVLAALLGVRAGRFVVRYDDSPCEGDWDASLRDAIEGPVAWARAAFSAIATPGRVARVELDAESLEPYLAATPQVAQGIVKQLSEGVSPSDLAASGISGRLLESVLSDLVLHACVSGIKGKDGEDLLAGVDAPRLATHSPAPPPVRQLKVAPAAEPAPAAPGPLQKFSKVTPVDFPRPPAVPGGLERAASDDRSSPPPAATGLSTPERAPALEGLESTGGPGEASVEVVGNEMEFADLLGDSLVPPPPAETPDEEEPARLTSAKAPAPPTSAPREPSPFEAALRALPAELSSPAPSPAVLEGGAPAPASALPPTVRDHRAPPRADAGKSDEAPALDLGAAVASLGDDAESPDVRATETRSGVPSGSGAAVAARVVPTSIPSPDEGPPFASAAVGSVARGASVAPHDASAEARPSPVPERERDTKPPTRRPSTVAASKKAPADAAPAGGGGALSIVAIVVIAAASSFALIRALQSDPRAVPVEGVAPSPPTEKAGAAQPREAPAPSPEPRTPEAPAAAPPAPPFGVESNLALPPGVTVEADRGLLEVDVGAPLSITVDGVLVGAGPVRQVPLRAGPHEVRIQGEGTSVARTVDIQLGRRTRVAAISVQ